MTQPCGAVQDPVRYAWLGAYLHILNKVNKAESYICGAELSMRMHTAWHVALLITVGLTLSH